MSLLLRRSVRRRFGCSGRFTALGKSVCLLFILARCCASPKHPQRLSHCVDPISRLLCGSFTNRASIPQNGATVSVTKPCPAYGACKSGCRAGLDIVHTGKKRILATKHMRKVLFEQGSVSGAEIQLTCSMALQFGIRFSCSTLALVQLSLARQRALFD